MNGVTYIVTVYNKQAYVADVLAAIRRQEGDFPRQIVIINDGSKDGSEDIIKACIADWPEAELVTQPNAGPSQATNRGLELARMPFIHLVDGDDIIAPYATRVLLRAQQESGCGLVYAYGVNYSSPDQLVFPAEPARLNIEVLDDPLYMAIKRGLAGSSAVLIRTADFRRVGGCDPEIFVQDQSLPQRLATVTKIAMIDHCLCMAPTAVPGRVMSLCAQVLHDQSLAALHTLRDHPDLPPRFHRLIQRRVTGRSWKWTHRKAGTGFLSRSCLLFLLARLPYFRLSYRAMESTLRDFAGQEPIRRPFPVQKTASRMPGRVLGY